MTNDELEALERKYDELLDRLVKGSDFLENPIIKPEVYEAGMRKFDRIWNELLPIRKQYWDYVLGRNEQCRNGHFTA